MHPRPQVRLSEEENEREAKREAAAFYRHVEL